MKIHTESGRKGRHGIRSGAVPLGGRLRGKDITQAETLLGERAVPITHRAPSLGVRHWEDEPTLLAPGLAGLTAGLWEACLWEACTSSLDPDTGQRERRLQGGWLTSHNHPGLHTNLRRVVTHDAPPHWGKGCDTPPHCGWETKDKGSDPRQQLSLARAAPPGAYKSRALRPSRSLPRPDLHSQTLGPGPHQAHKKSIGSNT